MPFVTVAMWLVVCHTTDLPALWAYRGLKACGLAPLELVSAEALGSGLRWEHRLGKQGTSLSIKLADGREISSQSLRGVLNRLLTVPVHLWQSAAEGDRDYVTQELSAFYLSWLYSLPCPVINRPTPLGLAGQWRSDTEWVRLAEQAGLATLPYQRSSAALWTEEGGFRLDFQPAARHTILTVAGRAAGPPAPPEVIEGCSRLGELAKTELLGAQFVEHPDGGWLFAGATPYPDLTLGGTPLLEALARTLNGAN